jgi:hypothetical protein
MILNLHELQLYCSEIRLGRQFKHRPSLVHVLQLTPHAVAMQPPPTVELGWGEPFGVYPRTLQQLPLPFLLPLLPLGYTPSSPMYYLFAGINHHTSDNASETGLAVICQCAIVQSLATAAFHHHNRWLIHIR